MKKQIDDLIREIEENELDKKSKKNCPHTRMKHISHLFFNFRCKNCNKKFFSLPKGDWAITKYK